MTILADFQIRELCTIPTFMVRFISNPENHHRTSNDNVTYMPTHRTVLEIMQMAHQADNYADYRPLTEEEKMNYPLMISPFVGGQNRVNAEGEKAISWGLSSFGMDVRISNEFKIFTNINSTVINPKDFNEDSFVDFIGDVCILPPNSFVLARSVEYFKMPPDVTGLVLGKSTYARTGISCLATPLECGWEGHITLEFANTTPLPSMLFANEGAAQVLFFKGVASAEITYADRMGKYNKQTGITLPKA